MDMTGEYRIPAPREKVWAALNDPETLKRSLPGCESLEKVSETEFVATVVAKVGPVKAKSMAAAASRRQALLDTIRAPVVAIRAAAE